MLSNVVVAGTGTGARLSNMIAAGKTGTTSENYDRWFVGYTPYYVAAVYTDAAGNTHCTGVIAYSLSKYCMNNANGKMGALAQATAMYGYYAAAYFV